MNSYYHQNISIIILSENRSLNSLSEEEISSVWIPFVIFDNTEHNDATKGTKDTEMTVSRQEALT